MRILIAGAAGFIGSHLSKRFVSEGHHVIGVDNFVTGFAENVAGLQHTGRFTLIDHDVIAPLHLTGDLDWVMHFASPASPPKYLAIPIETLRVSGEGTLHLLNLAKSKNARFFLASTSEIYGDPTVHPQPESYWGNVNPIGLRSVYDEAKRYAEACTFAYHRLHKLSTRVIRIFNTYGPTMDPQDGRVVTNFITQSLQGDAFTIYGDGKQTRSFQYVDDLVEGIARLMNVECYEPVNLGNPEEFTMIELAHLVNELMGTSLPIVHVALPQDDPRQRKPDISFAKSL